MHSLFKSSRLGEAAQVRNGLVFDASGVGFTFYYLHFTASLADRGRDSRNCDCGNVCAIFWREADLVQQFRAYLGKDDSPERLISLGTLVVATTTSAVAQSWI
jgi:hypothetical protein